MNNELSIFDRAINSISEKYYGDELSIRHKIITFYDGAFGKDRIVKGKMVSGFWHFDIDMEDFYNRFLSITAIRDNKVSDLIEK